MIDRARHWRIAAVVCAGVALVNGAGLVVAVSRAPKLLSWVVVADSDGRRMYSGPGTHGLAADELVRERALREWVAAWRGVSADFQVQRQWILKDVYPMVAEGKPARAVLDEFYQKSAPFERARHELVSVDVQSVVRVSDRAYEIEWSETARSPETAEVRGVTLWKGVFGVALNPPATEAEAQVNPLGLYVTQANWSQVSKGEVDR
jgi:type IV secretory pathway TrbF-like protein